MKAAKDRYKKAERAVADAQKKCIEANDARIRAESYIAKKKQNIPKVTLTDIVELGSQ